MSSRIVSKTFQYENNLRWNFSRVGHVASEGKPSLQVSSPPEFKGEAGSWTPEDLFVASANTCLLLTFLAYVEREKIAVTSYESMASGTVEKVGDSYRFTEIKVQPRVGLEDSAYAAQVADILQRAEKTCLIANSMRARMHVEPHILSVAD